MPGAGLSAIKGESAQAQGLLRVTMPGSFGRMHIIPALAEFGEQYPLINLDLRLSDEVLDVVEGAFDLVIRNAPLADSTLVARKLADDRRLLVASPNYLARYGSPETPDDLGQHQCLILADQNRWKFEASRTITAPRSCAVNDGEALRAMIESGLGIGIQSVWIASEGLKSGRMVEVLPDWKYHEVQVWAAYPETRLIPRRVTKLIELMIEEWQLQKYLPMKFQAPKK